LFVYGGDGRGGNNCGLILWINIINEYYELIIQTNIINEYYE